MSDAPIDRRRVYLMRHAEVSYFDERVLAAWNDLATRDAWRNLLLVAHDAVDRVVLTHVTGVGLSGLKAFEQDPACVIIIEIDVEGDKVSRAFLRVVNLTPYDLARVDGRLTVMEKVFRDFGPH